MVYIGTETSSFVLSHNLLQSVEFIASQGFNAIEILGDFPHAFPRQMEKLVRDQIKNIIEKNNIKPSIHTPFVGVNLAAINPGIREESVRQVNECVDFISELGGELAVIHGGKYDFLVPQAKEMSKKFLYDSLFKCTEYAAKKNVVLGLENTGLDPDDIPENNQHLVEIIKTVNSPNLQITWDVGHANVTEGVVDTLEILKPYIKHIHISDNHGKHDDHKAIGEMSIDYEPIIPFLKEFKDLIIMEIIDFEDTPGSLLRSYSSLKKMLDEE